MFINENMSIELRTVMSVPPKYSQEPRAAKRAEAEKDTKTTAVLMRAVTMMLGSSRTTRSSNGPMPIPVNNTD